MSKRFPRAKWVLPDVVNPSDRICYTIEVPNNRAHIGAFLGALYNLTSAIFWADDEAHTAKEVARVWQDIFDEMVKGSCQADNHIKIYGEYIDMPRFRDHCEHELFYLGCDDTEHQIAFLSDIPAGGQAGNGAPQPAAGGGQQNYCQKLNANQQMLLPTLVNSGDTIELVSASGAWWDGGENSLGFPIWRCPDGEQYIAGNCAGAGTEHITGTDPVVGAAHMSLIVYIGATAYSLASGPVTVPGGIANGNAVVQVNDTAISNNPGSADVCIRVTNNAAVNWCNQENFVTGPGRGVGQTDGANCATTTWVAGLGFVSGHGGGCGGANTQYSLIVKDLLGSAQTISTIRLKYHLDETPGTVYAVSLQGLVAGVVVHTDTTPPVTVGNHDVTIAFNMSIDEWLFDISVNASPSANIQLASVELAGSGANPFGSNNC